VLFRGIYTFLDKMAPFQSSLCDICHTFLAAQDKASTESEYSHVDTLFEVDEILDLRVEQNCHLCSIFAGCDGYVGDFEALRSRENEIALQGGRLTGTTTYQMLQNSDEIELQLRHYLKNGSETRRNTHSLPVYPRR
jgi:hypothetical protein